MGQHYELPPGAIQGVAPQFHNISSIQRPGLRRGRQSVDGLAVQLIMIIIIMNWIEGGPAMASSVALALPALLSLSAGWMGVRGALQARVCPESLDGHAATLRAEHALAGISLVGSALVGWNVALGSELLPRVLGLHGLAAGAGWVTLRLSAPRHASGGGAAQRLNLAAPARAPAAPRTDGPLLNESRGAVLPG